MKLTLQWLVVLMFLGFVPAFSQQDAQYSQYMFNSLYYNPAFAGTEGLTRFSFLTRIQWLGYQPTIDDGGAPQTHLLSGSTLLPLLNKSLGVGAHLVYDTRGPLSTTQFKLSGSYLYKIGPGTLSIGLAGGVLNQRISGDKYRVIDEKDEIYQQLKTGVSSQTKFDMGAGLWYKTTKYYAGVSFNHLTRTKFTYGFDSFNSQLANHMFITGGYNLNVGTMIIVTPSTMIQTDLKQLTYHLGGIATYNEKFWVGLQFRQSFARKEVANGGVIPKNDDVTLLVGVNLLKNKQNNNALRIGYAFDLVTSGVGAKTRTSHEILLSYIIPAPWEIVRPKVRTPRYRHDEN
ncbi:MAG TPA: type IX secretion system membrane protein PorP/SprF [Cytophagaceae bacterium]|jgi:type IX secretion system PorP/SprF family membrane protein